MTKDDYLSYLAAKKDVSQAEGLMEPRAKLIVKALRNQDASRFYFGETRVLYSCGQPGPNTMEPDGDFPAELLWASDWKDKIGFIIAEQDRRHNEWIAKCQAKAKKEGVAREIEEFKRLSEKFKGVDLMALAKDLDVQAKGES